MANEMNAKLVDFNGTASELKKLTEISKLAQRTLKDECNINITMAEAIPTIVYEFMYAAGLYLEKNKSTEEDVIVNLMNIIDIGVTYRGSEEGEKTGNFTPFVQAGTILKTVIKSDEMTEEED